MTHKFNKMVLVVLLVVVVLSTVACGGGGGNNDPICPHLQCTNWDDASDAGVSGAQNAINAVQHWGETQGTQIYNCIDGAADGTLDKCK